MIQIAFCDDNPMIHSCVDQFMPDIGLSADWELFSSGRELLQKLEDSLCSFQIYVLDIEMPDLNGIDLAGRIRALDRNAVIIFLTDYKEYVYEVFEVLPFRFLQKPLSREVLQKALQDAAAFIHSAHSHFFYQKKSIQLQLPFSDILYFESRGRKILLKTRDGMDEFYGRIHEVWDSLDPNLFTRPHVSYLVNMDFIREIRPDRLLLPDGVSIPVSRKYRSLVKQDHLAFMERRNGAI